MLVMMTVPFPSLAQHEDVSRSFSRSLSIGAHACKRRSSLCPALRAIDQPGELVHDDLAAPPHRRAAVEADRLDVALIPQLPPPLGRHVVEDGVVPGAAAPLVAHAPGAEAQADVKDGVRLVELAQEGKS